ncbi:extracellular catalytic domain type 2 short-chain-length polyhydroxyalkanoate depolymerase [Thauera linaloolentis]|nr:poly(3-hydroxybutyrate) depolymerase [Thauera linaloolentis]MCM8566249.1 poly(3-hydroxybutyrate) depolymerase [Thauera linaloolentis]
MMKQRVGRLTHAVGVLGGLLFACSAQAAPALPALGADANAVTVSGISSGAYMAVQLQVAHSRLVKGAGVVAGGPYECAEGSMWRALSNCMEPSTPGSVPTAVDTEARIAARARAGRIDDPAGLAEDRVWVFSGSADRTVERPVVDGLVAFYRSRLPQAAVRYVQYEGAGHAMISVADPAANACEISAPPFINRCGELDAAGELLAHLYGPLESRVERPAGDVIAFDQREFTGVAPFELSMAAQGYAYVPQACRAGDCRVHVALHGCRQGEGEIGRRFVDTAGYNEWADGNRIIVLYPQAAARSGLAWGSWRWVYNPKGCWDWWGYTGTDYATRDGGQVRAIRAMLARLAGPPARGGQGAATD